MLKGILENLSFYILVLMALFAVISMFLARSLMSKFADSPKELDTVSQTLETKKLETQLEKKSEKPSKPEGIEDYVYIKSKKEPGVRSKS